jgi:hypothetical protein
MLSGVPSTQVCKSRVTLTEQSARMEAGTVNVAPFPSGRGVFGSGRFVPFGCGADFFPRAGCFAVELVVDELDREPPEQAAVDTQMHTTRTHRDRNRTAANVTEKPVAHTAAMSRESDDRGRPMESWARGRTAGRTGIMDEGTELQSVTIREAAVASGVDRRTLQQHINDGVFPNAYRQQTAKGAATGPWFIPLGDLDAAGLALDASRIQPARPVAPRGMEAELDALRAELAEERTRRLVAEALANERATALEHARIALRALEALAGAVTTDDDRGPKNGMNEPPRPQLRGKWLR